MKTILSPMEFWFHDLCSCLQDCIATVLIYYGKDPILTLGASWDFAYIPADVRREEFYFPASRQTLAESMAPFHPIRSTWHRSDDALAAWEDVKAVVARGQPVIIAVDNFYIPFRPAFGDVHAAHLLVLFGFDDATGEAFVLESTPPQYRAPIPLSDYLKARSSDNVVEGERDYFFAGTPVDNRWLHLEIDEPFPELTREWVAEVVATNLRRFYEPDTEEKWSGLAGLARYLRSICERAAGSDSAIALEELYTVGWTAQGCAALHADFLRLAGRRLDWPRLAEVGRHVDQLANQWTAIRMIGAHCFTRPDEALARLDRRISQLLSDHQQTLEMLEQTIKTVR